MARIPDEDIERIKQSVDLAALVRSRGVALKKHGSKDLIGTCPFHPDKTPSFVVTPSKGLFHCLGCGAAGNVIQFAERFDGLSFRHAFELLNEGHALDPRPPAKGGNGGAKIRSTFRSIENPLDLDTSDAELLGQVIDYYHQRLLSESAPVDYLKKRGIYNEEAIEKFKLGFADRTLGLRLPEKAWKEGKAIRERLQSLGLIRESGHEHFNGSIIVPVLDDAGSIAEIYGRKITPKLRKGTPNHLYLPGPHQGIWNAECLAGDEIILCEAPLDALTFWVNGIRNVTFIYGTEGFPGYLLEALLAHRIKTVRLAYDNDEAGNRAAERDAKKLSSKGIEVYRVKFPHKMDVNDFAQKITPAQKSLAVAVQSAEWLCGSTSSGLVPSCAPTSSSLVASPPEVDVATNKNINLPAPELTRQGDYYALTLGSRVYRVGGLEKNNSLEVMKISLRLRQEENFHLDSFDLCRDNERRRFIERAAEETGLEKALIKKDLGKLLLALEETQEARLNSSSSEPSDPQLQISDDEREEALAFLQSPKLIENIADTFDQCGLVGETGNRLAAYLACTSRKLDRPLAVIIQSTSAAGKSTLMEAVLAFFPEEEQVKYSAMTGQSLYYLGETNLKHRILAIVEEEGAEKASYALKLLQSEGELTIASTGKDSNTGRMETQEYHVEGPTMIFLTTTAIDIDEELLNRCLVLTVDESREQTERIHTLQRQARTLEGLQLKKKKRRHLSLLRNVQRLLKSVDVVNPWADQLTFTAERTRTRRDHEKYLTLIDSIALLHQHQRPREKYDETCPDGEGEYISVTLEDIALANRLAPELLGRSLDELPPQSRRLLDCIKKLVRDLCKLEELEQSLAFFSRRELCELSGWTYSQVKRHLARLQELEYIAVRYGSMGAAMRYELLMDMNHSDEGLHVGLLDVANLKGTTATCTPKGGGCTPPCQSEPSNLSTSKNGTKADLAKISARTSGAAEKVVVP